MTLREFLGDLVDSSRAEAHALDFPVIEFINDDQTGMTDLDDYPSMVLLDTPDGLRRDMLTVPFHPLIQRALALGIPVTPDPDRRAAIQHVPMI